AGRRPEFERKFDTIWRETRDQFYDSNMNGCDWQAAGSRYRQSAEAANSHAEFQEIVNKMLGELRASHLGYYTDQDLEYYLLSSLVSRGGGTHKVKHIGVTGVRENGAFVVRAVLDGSPAAAEGIRVGDHLLTVNGRPFTTVGSFQSSDSDEFSLAIDRPG